MASLRDESDETRTLRAFGDRVQAFVQMNDVSLITRQLLAEAVQSLDAESGALSLVTGGRLQTVHTVGPWRDQAYLSVPLMANGERVGLLQLGPHQLEQTYSQREGQILQQVADQVAAAVALLRLRYPGPAPFAGAAGANPCAGNGAASSPARRQETWSLVFCAARQ